MADFEFSSHALKQMEDRGISAEMVLETLHHPLTQAESDGQKVYQRLIKIERMYLIRVFVNITKSPMLIKTVYRTSKIDKYYEGEI